MSVLKPNIGIDKSSDAIEKDDSKCVRCQRTVRVCADTTHINVIAVAHKGKDMKISTFILPLLNDVICVNCCQYVTHCLTNVDTYNEDYFIEIQ